MLISKGYIFDMNQTYTLLVFLEFHDLRCFMSIVSPFGITIVRDNLVFWY